MNGLVITIDTDMRKNRTTDSQNGVASGESDCGEPVAAAPLREIAALLSRLEPPAEGLRPMPFGNSATQSHRDYTKTAQRFNAGLDTYGKASPGGAKEIPVPLPQSAVPDGTDVAH